MYYMIKRKSDGKDMSRRLALTADGEICQIKHRLERQKDLYDVEFTGLLRKNTFGGKIADLALNLGLTILFLLLFVGGTFLLALLFHYALFQMSGVIGIIATFFMAAWMVIVIGVVLDTFSIKIKIRRNTDG